MAHDNHPSHSHRSDAKAAFAGLFIGAIVLFGIVRTIISLTNAKYAHEKPAATATK
jgi:uncharacterized membrane protein YdjX (TVP38/TMEM64 family)